jgi:hypothetical protein
VVNGIGHESGQRPARERNAPQIECYGHQCQGLRGTWPRMCP